MVTIRVASTALIDIDRAETVAVETTADEAILTALNRHGYTYRVGCRRGGCGVCKADLIAGTVNYPAIVSTEVLTDTERATGTCLTCRAVPTSDVEIQLRNTTLITTYLARFLTAPTVAPTDTSTTRTINSHKGEMQ